MKLEFTIPGEPLGKPRMTQRDRWAKRPCVLRYRAWADRAREAFTAAGGTADMLPRVLGVSWTAYFVPPKSWSRRRREMVCGTLHRSKPDRDNIDKAVLDALLPNDSGVAFGELTKLWDDEPRLVVRLELTGGAS